VPTKKPRLNITLSPAARSALERFSQISGIAASQFISKIVEDSIPVIDSMTAAFEVARKSPIKAAQIMSDMTHVAMVNVAQESLAFEAEVRKPRLRKRPTRD
jgi:hypothetical protein